jgi:hypothetical protein
MKLSNRIALMFTLSAGLLSGAALAQDAATAPAAAPAPTTMNDMVSPKPAHHHNHKARTKAASGSKYDNCLKEKLAVANAYCSAHSDACKAEKDGAAAQCKSEARGERQKG